MREPISTPLTLPMHHPLPGFEDLFLTLPLELFRQYIRSINALNRRDRNNLLATFERHKERTDRSPVRRMANDVLWSNTQLKRLVNQLLQDYWHWRDHYAGGLIWCRLPPPLPRESSQAYLRRNEAVMQPLIQVLCDELNYLNTTT